jgi:CelD/BcsL family acetyltransferase involved in cellulose biosynthesis
MNDGQASPSGVDARDLSIAIAPASAVADLATLWRDLEARADASFFLSWHWIGTWLAVSGLSPLLLTARLGGSVVGLALLHPARLSRHLVVRPRALLLHQSGDPALDCIAIEYNGILADRRCADRVYAACIAHLARDARWDELYFSAVTAPFAAHAQRTALTPWVRARAPSWRVDLDGLRRDGRPYLATLGANTRYQIRRALRLYERRGPLGLTAAANAAEAAQFFDGLKQLHQRTWQARHKDGSFAHPFFERFHRALLADGIGNGSVELVRVAAGSDVIGYLYNFLYRGHVYNYQTGFAYESDAKLKPGLVSHHLSIERHLERGAQVYDFLAGDQRYKHNLGTSGPEMLDLVLQHALPMLAAERALRRAKSTIISVFR